MGCWIDLQGENEGDKIRVKVKDGEIVFPVEVKGKTALVEGEIYALTDAMNSEEETEMQEGEDCAPPKTGKKVYQIKGFGAVIK
jgi:hypothetical protein